MKVLVTGGTGFVGTNLIKRLLKDGHEVISVDNYSTGVKENEQKGCQYYTYDIASDHTIGIYVDHGTYPSWRDEEFDVIYHMAALARIQPSLEHPASHIKNNFNSTLHILELARKKEIPVVYAGSSSFHCGLYGSPYAWSKYGGEELCRLYSSVYDTPTAICRFYNVYGPHQILDSEYAAVIGIWINQSKKGEPLTNTDEGEQLRDFTNVEYVSKVLLNACKFKKRKDFDIFHVSSNNTMSIKEFALQQWKTFLISGRRIKTRRTCQQNRGGDAIISRHA